jgi:hypothetical protein
MGKVPVRRRGLPAALIVLGLVALAVLVPIASGASAPSLTSSPSTWDYGTIDANTTASKTFVFTNTGSGSTGELTVSLTGSSAFTNTGDTCTGRALGPNKTCSVTVEYAPTSTSSTDSGTLTVSSRKTSTSATLTGKSTNQAPIVELTAESTTPPFNFGDTVNFSVVVTDDQPVDCARVSVTYILGHEMHGHPQETIVGCSGSFDVPAEDAEHGANVFAVFHASYTDTGEPPLTTTDEVVLRP